MSENIRTEANWNQLSSYEQDAERLAPKKWLNKEEIIELSKIKHWRWIGELALTWGLLVATLQVTIMLGKVLPLWAAVLVYGVSFVLMGCLQNWLIQWRHEASHYCLTRDKKLNDLIGDIFIAGPVGSTTRNYRFHHVSHHMYLNDPDKEVQPATWICLRGGHLLTELVTHLVGFWYVTSLYKTAKEAEAKPNAKPENKLTVTPAALASFFVVNGTLFALCALQGAWFAYFILWLMPPITVAQLINNFRTIVEHQPSSDICDVGRSVKLFAFTRVIRANPIERWLIAPVGFYFHHEHHAWPSIPYHRLGETRRLLQKKGYFDQDGIIYTDGYLKTVWQLAHQPDYGLRILNPFMDMEKFEEEHDHHHDHGHSHAH
ncbi:MAG: fatty acid desaturase [bacterium]|nr:fatty acid desaturase [bacterium]